MSMEIPPLSDNNIVAVYWTLKKQYWNHRVMESAKWEFLKETYVEFSRLTWTWFPYWKFTPWTGKFLKVECYNVPEEWVLNYLDRLEWHPNFYRRKEVPTIGWEMVVIYESVWDIWDTSEQWKKTASEWILNEYYEWWK